MTKDEEIDKIWENSGHGATRSDIIAAYEAGENAKNSKLEEENAELRKYLKIAISEADSWHDDDNGGPIPEGMNEAFDYARKLIDS